MVGLWSHRGEQPLGISAQPVCFGSSQVRDNIQPRHRLVPFGFFRGGEGQLGGGEGAQSRAAGDAILGAQELEVTPRLGGVVRAEDGVALVLAVAVESDELGGNQVVAVQVHPQKDNQWIDDEQRPFQGVEQPEQQGEGVVLEQADIDILIVNQRGVRDGLHVEADILGTKIQRMNRAVPGDVGSLVRGHRDVQKSFVLVPGMEELEDQRAFATARSPRKHADFAGREEGVELHSEDNSTGGKRP